MRIGVRSLAVAGLATVTVIALAAMGPLSGIAHQNPLDSAGTGIALGIPFGAVGAIVARRQPRNPIGWLSLAFSACFLISVDAGYCLVLAYRLGHAVPLAPAFLFLQPLWEPALAMLPLIILLFPDGRLPSPRWRLVMWTYVALTALFLADGYASAATAIADHRIAIDASGDLASAAHSTGVVARLGSLGFALIVVIALAFAGRQALSWRRSSGDRRQQLKWLSAGGCVSIVCVAASAPAGSAGGNWAVVSNVLGFGIVATPLAVGIGILKYRLYDIDRIISRTLAYAIVTGLLVGVYAALVVLATEALPVRLSGSVAVAGSTLVAAALFNPLRRRVQHLVDRRFNRARYDADQTTAAFAARLQESVELQAVLTDLGVVVQQTLEPAHMSLWMSRQG